MEPGPQVKLLLWELFFCLRKFHRDHFASAWQNVIQTILTFNWNSPFSLVMHLLSIFMCCYLLQLVWKQWPPPAPKTKVSSVWSYLSHEWRAGMKTTWLQTRSTDCHCCKLIPGQRSQCWSELGGKHEGWDETLNRAVMCPQITRIRNFLVQHCQNTSSWSHSNWS